MTEHLHAVGHAGVPSPEQLALLGAGVEAPPAAAHRYEPMSVQGEQPGTYTATGAAMDREMDKLFGPGGARSQIPGYDRDPRREHEIGQFADAQSEQARAERDVARQ